MWVDPIVEEIRRNREAYAKDFNYDLKAMYDDLKEEEKRCGFKVVSLPIKRRKPANLP
jgi:rubrerythrin